MSAFEGGGTMGGRVRECGVQQTCRCALETIRHPGIEKRRRLASHTFEERVGAGGEGRRAVEQRRRTNQGAQRATDPRVRAIDATTSRPRKTSIPCLHMVDGRVGIGG